ncbi:MAG TPA: DUF1512 family protein [Thermoproteota archaeon]|nr:DUF1512 family protein [Thermoproteota archaeon]
MLPSTLLAVLGQFELQLDIPTLLNILFMMVFLLVIVFQQRIQVYLMLREIELVLRRIDLMKDEGRRISLEKLKKSSTVPDPSAFLDRVMDYVLLEPVSLDPAGIVPKLDYILKTGDDRLKEEIKQVASKASEVERDGISSVVEIAATLSLLYRTVRHYYIMGKKTGSQLIIMQLQMILPEVMIDAEALMGGLYAYDYGHPIGDGSGAQVAANLAYPKEFKETGRDMEVCETEFEGRKLTLLKSKGPGATVGYPGDSVQDLIKKKKYDLVVMMDAGMKLEGEKSGTILEGIGAAIGGPGTERYKIEEIVAKKKIPVYAMLIRMSYKEVITPITEDILKGVDAATARVKEVVREKVPHGGKVLVVGVGNTIGVK